MSDRKDTEFNYNRDTWKTVHKLLSNSKYLAENQINSYNELVLKLIPGLIKNHSPIVSGINWDEGLNNYRDRYELHIDNIYFSKPMQHSSDAGYQPLLPNDARQRDLTYSAPMFIDYHQNVYKNGVLEASESEQKVPLSKIPVMVNSILCYLNNKTDNEKIAYNECKFDKGGYFIINGSEKVIIAQERPVDNNLMLFDESNKQNRLYVACADVLSSPDQKYFPIKRNSVYLCKQSKKSTKGKDFVVPGKKLEVKMPVFNKPTGHCGIPLFIVFRALGIISDQKIFEMIVGDIENVSNIDSEILNLLVPSAYEAIGIVTQEDALNYLAREINIKTNKTDTEQELIYKLKYTKGIINREFLSHVGQDNYRKACYLAYMVRKLLTAVVNPALFSDRDHYSNKRVDLSGALCMHIIRHNFTKLVRDIKTAFNTSIESGKFELNKEIRKTIQKCTIESKLKYALSTGNWQTQTKHATKNSESKKGIAQVLKRLSILDSLSHIRRIQSPLESSGSKYEPPRRYHFTQVGKICMNETPEGQQVGVVKNLSLACHVTLECESMPVRLWLSKIGITDITVANPKICPYSTNVLINGDLIGIIESPEHAHKVYKTLKACKINGKISIYTSIAWYIEKNELHIQTDGGRYCRPLYLIDSNNFKINYWVEKFNSGEYPIPSGISTFEEFYDKVITWEHMKLGYPEFDSGKITRSTGSMIEFIDTNEEECSLIAIFPHQLIPGKEHKVNPDDTLLCEVTYDNSVIVLPTENLNEYFKTLVIPKYHYMLEKLEISYVNKYFIKIKLPEKTSEFYESIKVFARFINRFIYDTYETFTHCDIHPALWHSVVSQGIPFPEHNPSARNCYQNAMGKQAIGLFVSNFTNRVDTVACNVLTYPQKPLVEPRTVAYTPLSELYHGYQAIVAILISGGYNQEDSILQNQGSIEAGMLNILHYYTYKNKQQKHKTTGSDDEIYGVPPDPTNVLGPEYHAVGRDTGYPQLGKFVHEKDIIISKYKKSGKSDVYDDITTKVSEEGLVDYVIPNKKISNEDGDGYKFVKVRISNLRFTNIGDKFASRSAQKGTVSMKYRRCDMPMTSTGIIPEIIMNPHAIPSRMTIGQILEALLGKLASISGKSRDATPFTHFDLNVYKEELKNYGYDYNGNEYMYNGRTGEMLKVAVFINPTYYQRLKHMVDDKMHSRDLGPIQLMTRQPAEGRSHEGGLRFGEMERDCMISHGTAQFLKEKTIELSDIFKVYHSRETGEIITANPQEGIYRQGNTDILERDHIDALTIPFAANLLLGELKCSFINCKLQTASFPGGK